MHQCFLTCTAQLQLLAEQEAAAHASLDPNPSLTLNKCRPCAPGLLHRAQHNFAMLAEQDAAARAFPDPNSDPSPEKKAGHARQGFYTVYSAIFATLAEQEAAARARGGRGGADDAPAPGFGGSGAAWDGVLAFYAHWQGFSTAKDFAWADQYNPGSAPNRKARPRRCVGRGFSCLAF